MPSRGNIMHTKLSKPPVRYVLAQVKFSNIEAIAKYTDELQDTVRDLFPHFQQVDIQSIQLTENQQSNVTTTVSQWHFINKEKNTGIILDKQSLTIHSSCYEQIQPFLDTFKRVSNQFNKILNITLFTQLGLRYINLIENGLIELDKGLQGFQLKKDGFKENEFLTKTETVQRSQEGVIRVRATRVKDKALINGDIQRIVMPPDLLTTSELLSFEHYSEPSDDFLVLDTDHINGTQGDFDIADILDRFYKLQAVSYEAFCQAVGAKNLAQWR